MECALRPVKIGFVCPDIIQIRNKHRTASAHLEVVARCVLRAHRWALAAIRWSPVVHRCGRVAGVWCCAVNPVVGCPPVVGGSTVATWRHTTGVTTGIIASASTAIAVRLRIAGGGGEQSNKREFAEFDCVCWGVWRG